MNLQKAGVYKYAESPDFDILLFGYSVDGGAVLGLEKQKLTGGFVDCIRIDEKSGTIVLLSGSIVLCCFISIILQYLDKNRKYLRLFSNYVWTTS